MSRSIRMPVARYRRVLAIRSARDVLLLGMLLRVPMFAGMVLLTVHVVQTLGRSYTEAGLVATCATLAVAVSGPWRGRLLDRLGLRRVVLPSALVGAACWAVAPFQDYLLLLVLASVAGLFAVPSFSVVRASLIAQVPEQDRRTALSLDSVLVETAFMIGPLVGIWASAYWSTSWLLFAVEMFGAAVAGLLWLMDPPLRSPEEELDRPRGVGEALDTDQHTVEHQPTSRRRGLAGVRQLFTLPVLLVCLGAAAVTFVLGGSDISVVAAMRQFDAYQHIGVVLAVWGLGSLVGGLVYGGLSRPVPAAWLLGLLAATTIPLAFAVGPWSLALLALVAGLFCAPSITATVDQLSRAVPASARAEAMGWHGSFMTVGSALGAPLAGSAIDRNGFAGGFVVAGVVGLTGAVALAAVTWRSGRPRAAEAVDERTPLLVTEG